MGFRTDQRLGVDLSGPCKDVYVSQRGSFASEVVRCAVQCP